MQIGVEIAEIDLSMYFQDGGLPRWWPAVILICFTPILDHTHRNCRKYSLWWAIFSLPMP